MKTLKQLKDERFAIVTQMESLTAGDEMNEDQKVEWESFNSKVEKLDRDITIAEKQEKLNKQSAAFSIVETPETEDKTVDMISGLREFFSTGVAPQEFRSTRGGFIIPPEVMESFDDLVTTTDSAIVNKTVLNGISIAKSPAERLVGELGVTQYNSLNGNLVLPAMAQVNAGFVAETVAVADASAYPQSVTLAARRVGAYNVFSKEFLAQTNPGIYQGVVQDLYDAVWRAVVADMFDQIQTDTVDASTIIAGSTLAYADFVSLQANVPYDLTTPSYVATPAIAAWAKKTATIASVNGPVWEGSVMDGMVDGIQAKGTALANTDHLLYGDFTKAAIGQWGGIELLVNPYEFDAEGKIKVTASGMFDSGAANYRYFSWIADVSI